MAWRDRATEIGGAGVAAAGGAIIGRVISWDMDGSASAGVRECAQSTGICVGTGPVAGLALGIAFTVAACWLTMADGRVRPTPLTVPVGLVLIVVATFKFLGVVRGGRLHPAWAFSLTIALTLGFFALVPPVLRAVWRAGHRS
jgi:hypothetical protein